MATHSLSHHGRTTSYRLSDRGGDGPTVLCIHGSGGSSGIWKSQSRIADAAPIAAVDLSGHGESEDVDADAGYETLSAYVDDVVAVADAVDADVLCGNSLGGAVAILTALDRDLALDGLILAGTGGRLAVLDDLLEWLDHDFEKAVEFLHGTDRLFHDPENQYVELSRAAMFETGRAVTARDFRSSHVFDERDRLEDISVPSLAIVGEHDQLTPPWYHEYLAEHIPDAELAVLEDAAHLAMLERPTAFNAAVSAFLDRLA